MVPEEFYCRDPQVGVKGSWTGNHSITEAQERVAKETKKLFGGMVLAKLLILIYYERFKTSEFINLHISLIYPT